MNTALLLRTIDVWMTYRLRPFYLRAKCQGTFFVFNGKTFFSSLCDEWIKPVKG